MINITEQFKAQNPPHNIPNELLNRFKEQIIMRDVIFAIKPTVPICNKTIRSENYKWVW